MGDNGYFLTRKKQFLNRKRGNSVPKENCTPGQGTYTEQQRKKQQPKASLEKKAEEDPPLPTFLQKVTPFFSLSRATHPKRRRECAAAGVRALLSPSGIWGVQSRIERGERKARRRRREQRHKTKQLREWIYKNKEEGGGGTAEEEKKL